MSKKLFFLIFVVAVFCGISSGYEGQDFFGEYAIVAGVPAVDGVISTGEWDNANWLDLDQVYYGSAADLTNAKWAAMWSPVNNLIYVVVTGTDTVQIFGEDYADRGDWNKYDLVEIYIDATNSDMDPYQLVYVDGQESGEDYAQQWMTGNDGNGGTWCVLPQEPDMCDTNPLPDEYRPQMATSIVGNVLTYEYALDPYESFGWLSGRETKTLQLEADLCVGLDVVMSSKSSTTFGMYCENAWRGDEDFDGDGEADEIVSIDKWNLASSFLDHWLVLDPNQSWRPRPANKALEVPREVTLKWNAGRNAASHHIYFGSNFNDVSNATDPEAGPVGRGVQSRANNTYPPPECPLHMGQTYYWRVDEANGSTIWKGNIWRFEVRKFLSVDDFDSYEDDKALEKVWNDGWFNLTWSDITLATDAYYTRDGNSMSFYYDNQYDPFYSETDAETTHFVEVGPNWQDLGVKALSIWFHGDVDNVVEPMYVELEDGAGHFAMVLYDDANDVRYPYWKEWNIALQDFEDGGVSLDDVARIYIGTGDKYGGTSGGAGNLWFDDIRLYLPRCVPEHAKADFTGDCITDFADLEIMTGDWLESDFEVSYTAPSGTPVLWYKFDEISGKTAYDSSGNGYNGTVTDAAWTDGYIDGSLNFDGLTTEVSVPIGAFSTINKQITIALWQYGDVYLQPKDDNLFEGIKEYYNTPGVRVLNAHLPWSDELVIWCAGNPNDVYDANAWDDAERIEKAATEEEYEGRWNHWAFIKNMDANDGGGVMKVYLNGFLWNIGYDYSELPTRSMDKFTIGNGADGFYAGRIDDFRVYNYELSQEELVWLATLGTGYYPLQSRIANLHEDESIDFKDFRILANYWLEDVLFPSP